MPLRECHQPDATAGFDATKHSHVSGHPLAALVYRYCRTQQHSTSAVQAHAEGVLRSLRVLRHISAATAA